MKRITIFVVLVMAMVLCLALTGCGQNTDKQEPSNSAATSDDGGKGEVTNTEPTKDTASNSSSVDNFNPKRDASGLYVYDVQGHEIRTRTNVWDYIGTVKVDGVPYENYFKLYRLAEDLGYDEMYNLDGLYKHVLDDGRYFYSGFQHDGSSGESNITSGIRNADNSIISSGVLRVSPYNSSAMEYRYNIGDYKINLDMIILCTYSMEYYADGNTGKCWEDIFGVNSPTIDMR